jgi:hypothetical protein
MSLTQLVATSGENVTGLIRGFESRWATNLIFSDVFRPNFDPAVSRSKSLVLFHVVVEQVHDLLQLGLPHLGVDHGHLDIRVAQMRLKWRKACG